MLSKDGTLFEKWIKEALKMFKKMSLKKDDVGEITGSCLQ